MKTAPPHHARRHRETRESIVIGRGLMVRTDLTDGSFNFAARVQADPRPPVRLTPALLARPGGNDAITETPTLCLRIHLGFTDCLSLTQCISLLRSRQ